MVKAKLSRQLLLPKPSSLVPSLKADKTKQTVWPTQVQLVHLLSEAPVVNLSELL